MLLTTFTVSNLQDGLVFAPDQLPGSLRQAIFDANANPGQDEIQFDSLSGSILLSLGQLEVFEDVVINGPGAGQLTIDADGSSRVLYVAQSTDLQISDLTLTGGSVTALGLLNGGGIYSRGTVTIERSVISGNEAGSVDEVGKGGAIYSSGPLTIRDTTVADNTASTGGGIYQRSATLDIADSVISGNVSTIDVAQQPSAGGIATSQTVSTDVSILNSTISNNTGGYGGGLWLGTGEILIQETSVTQNSATDGGGIVIVNNDADATMIKDSLIANNTAYQNGGGLFSRSRTGVVLNSTITGNVANAAGSYGGGIQNLASLFVIHSTVVNNTSPNGSGIHSEMAMRLQSSIVANNLSGPESSGSILSEGYNLTTEPAFWLQASDQQADPNLAALADNGGPTWTHALQAGSPAIDAGDPTVEPGDTVSLAAATVEIPFADQRGVPYSRMYGARTDIGAFEQSNGPADIDFNADAVFDCEDIDALVQEIVLASNLPAFDLNGDGQVDLFDRDTWLAFAADENGFASSYLLGDANLDGVVDGLDFIIWNGNKFTPNAAWCAGDFDADGIVDGLDFIEWNNNKFTGIEMAPIVQNRSREFVERAQIDHEGSENGGSADLASDQNGAVGARFESRPLPAYGPQQPNRSQFSLMRRTPRSSTRSESPLGDFSESREGGPGDSRLG